MNARCVALTGASRGIGEATALHLCRLGFHVLAGVRKESDGQALARKAPGTLTPLLLDVTDEASIHAAAETITRTVGDAGLAGLVNNAGLVIPGPLEFVPIDAVRQQFEVNVVGQLAVTQALLPLVGQARGRIVNMGSIGGRVPAPFVGAYHASKAALAAMSEALRAELRPWGIEVILVEPGNVATPIWNTTLTTAAEMERGAPPRFQELYGRSVAAVREWVPRTSAQAMPPECVARVVGRALTSHWPRTRYLVGWDAWVASWLVWLPDRLRGAFLLRWTTGHSR
jgi:NAD(P)-dependent dehydrogenase (short-subunit alcohol dehydrogenase family)